MPPMRLAVRVKNSSMNGRSGSPNVAQVDENQVHVGPAGQHRYSRTGDVEMIQHLERR